MDSPNPYKAPAVESQVSRPSNHKAADRMLLLCFAWLVLYSINMVFPLMIGWQMTEEHGRIGMFLAVALLLFAGWGVCWYAKKIAAVMIIGSILVGLSQLFPIIHIVVGILAIGIGEFLGLIDDPASLGILHSLQGDLGGFVITLITGVSLIAISIAIGFLIKMITPSHWWDRSGKDSLKNVTSNIRMNSGP